jgi:muconolactone delta-isomerase
MTGRRNMVPDPDPATLIALMQAAKEHQMGLLEDGTLDCVYGFLEGNGGFAIANADSHEDAQTILLQYPLFMNYDWEVKPVCDLIPQYDRFIDLWKSQIG